MIKKIISNTFLVFLLYSSCKNSTFENSMLSKQLKPFKNFSSYLTPDTTKWICNDTYNFHSTSLQLLLQDDIPLVRIKNFLSKDECEVLTNNIKKFNFDLYKNVYPPINKLGITQFEHSKSKEKYFANVNKFSEIREKIFLSSKINVFHKIKNSFLKKEYKLQAAYEPELGKYFYGLIRNLNCAAYVHFDYAKYDAPNWFISNVDRWVYIFIKIKVEFFYIIG